MTTHMLRKLVAIGMAVVIVISLAVWFLTRETYPDVLRIATAAEGGLYYQVGLILETHLEASTGRDVLVLTSRGSVENRELLLRGEADLAILQGGRDRAGRFGGAGPDLPRFCAYRRPPWRWRDSIR